MAESLTVEKRATHGKHHAKRLRQAGAIPAVLYGHGEEPVSLSVPRDAFVAALRHGTRLVELQGGVRESALIRDLQWDTYGTGLLHIDFARVSADEKVKVTVQVELRGQAAGTRAGGVIQHLVHSIEIECLATAIPEKLQVNINHLEMNGTITVGQIELPAGVTLLSDGEAIAVQCVEPAAEVEAAEAGLGEAAEPEVIGRKPESEEDEEKA
ncbi:MAG TPA: 50S ribosomal protein L25 [Pirellulales bacterium]|jgi:large subunit ribosomal protein L25|nr:50S ribosomal protein L25 [Pirellulales bacterium]